MQYEHTFVVAEKPVQEDKTRFVRRGEVIRIRILLHRGFLKLLQKS